MQTFTMYIKDGIWINFNSLFFFNIFCKSNLIILFYFAVFSLRILHPLYIEETVQTDDNL